MRSSYRARILCAGWAVATSGCAPSARIPPAAVTTAAAGPRITHGVMAGEVTATSAVIWSRCDRAADVRVALNCGDGRESVAGAPASATNDFTAQVTITQLQPETRCAYQVRCATDTGDSGGAGDPVSGTLRTAPRPDSARPVTIVWGGDVGGQNVCRDQAEGYPIFDTIAALRPDFFIGLGDMIYADSICLARGRYGNLQVPGPDREATDVPEFWAYWKYNRADQASQRLLAATPYYAVWDDHEVFNDFGPRDDTGPSPPYPAARHLLPPGLKAFRDYNPLPDAPAPLYRRVRWGQHLEVFILDTRSFRDANAQRDDRRRPKTMLGREQRRWLKDGLRSSDATWKVIVTSVPLSIPTGSDRRGRDGWANVDQRSGFERELLDLLRFMQRHRIRNHLWISTDIHYVAAFRYTPFIDDPTFESYEVDTGPLNAGVFPKREFDTTLHPTQLSLYPESAPESAGFAAAKAWFNFGVLRIDARGDLHVEVVNTYGARLYELGLPRR